MEAELQRDRVSVSMTRNDAQALVRELTKWPDLPKVERDLVEALQQLPSVGSKG